MSSDCLNVALFLTRTALPYQDARLSRDFADVRAIAFPGDARRLMDMRRSGVVEAIAGGADALGLAAKLANSINRSNVLHKTTRPWTIEAVKSTDQARLHGRRRMRRGDGDGTGTG